MKDGTFIDTFMRFHKLDGYVRADTYIEYETDFMKFSYDETQEHLKFNFQWKEEERWNYRRPKVTYIPAERNMVANISNWYDVMTNDDNIRDFMRDWDVARSATATEIDVLNLGIKYRHENTSKKDKVIVEDGLELDLTNTSSGIQSLIPLYVHLNYLNKILNIQEKNKTISKVNENEMLLRIILKDLFLNTNKLIPLPSKSGDQSPEGVIKRIGNIYISFSDVKYAEECMDIYERYTNTNYFDVFLEEPEENLFPPTQKVLIDWLLEITNGEHPSNIFVATHSPYILTSFLEKADIDLGLFFTPFHNKGNKTIVKSASKEDIQAIYDFGIDAFFNIEYFV